MKSLEIHRRMHLLFYAFPIIVLIAVLTVPLWMLGCIFGNIREQRLKFHLSTAVVLSVAAGLLMWLNTQEKKIGLVTLSNGEALERVYGWPCAGFERRPLITTDASTYLVNPLLIINVGLALLILFAVGGACEWWIRRKKHVQ